MKKLLYYLLLLCVGLVLMMGCKDKENDQEKQKVPSSFVGSWKMKGFGNNSSHKFFREPEPQDCDSCYVICFFANGDWKGFSSANNIEGKVVIEQNEKSLRFLRIEGTHLIEEPDGELFMASLRKIESYATFFSATDSILHLYFENGEKYLLFEKIK